VDAALGLPILSILIGVALLFDFLNGLHDAANSIATIVSTRVLRPQYAVLWAAFFNFIAFAVFGLHVANTIGTGIIDPSIVDAPVIFAALIGAIVWNLITWGLGIPSSSSHALIGGLVGAGMAKAGLSAAVWSGLSKTLAAIVLSPLVGFALAMAIGIPIAVIMTYSRIANQMFYPLLVASQSIPKVAVAPILLVWFGTGIKSKLAMAFVIAFFPVVVDTATGLRSTSPELIELARSLQCTRLQTFFKIQLPSALPSIFSGAKIAVTLSVIGAVIGEFIGSNEGLGNLLLTANSQLNSPLVWASLTVLSVLGVILYGFVVVAERLLMPWAVDADPKH